MISDTQNSNNTKKYYTIGEIARLLNVSTSLIRFWEKKFPSLQPRKNKQGARQYTQANIAQLRRIYQLVKEQGYTLHGAQCAIKYQKSNPQNSLEIVQALKKIRSFLVFLKENAR